MKALMSNNGSKFDGTGGMYTHTGGFAASAAYYSLGKGTEEIESVDGHWTDSVYFGKPGPSLESYLAGEGKSIWNSYSPGLVAYKGVDPYPRQVVA